MPRLPDVPAYAWTIVSLAWVLVFLALAVVAFWRFRLTASGLLLGGGFLFSALLDLLSLLLSRLVLAEGTSLEQSVIFSVVVTATFFILSLVSVAGVLLIPRSLRSLASRR